MTQRKRANVMQNMENGLKKEKRTRKANQDTIRYDPEWGGDVIRKDRLNIEDKRKEKMSKWKKTTEEN